MQICNTIFQLPIDFGMIWPVLVFCCSLLLCYLFQPIVIKISRLKGLLSKPNSRSVHTTKTANLGGIGIYLAVYIIITIFGSYFENNQLIYVLGAITIMFMLGVIDDLISVAPKTKIILQAAVSLYIIIVNDIRLENLQGLLGIYEIPYTVSILLTVFIFIILINAYNLIDGVDGLAGCFAIIASVLLGIFFYLQKNFELYFLSIIMVGALIAFLRFNFSKKNKIFMGDTGTMVVGFLLAYLTLNAVNTEVNEMTYVSSVNILLFVLALFSFPIIDTVRVFCSRLKSGKHPFIADKNHTHHILLGIGLKHYQIALVAVALTLCTVIILFVFRNLYSNLLLFILINIWALSLFIISKLKHSKIFQHLNNNQMYPFKRMDNYINTDNKKGMLLFMNSNDEQRFQSS